MSQRRHTKQFGSTDRIAAFAEATEAYAETLEDPDLANVYWGKSLGLWQAFEILSAEDRATGAGPRGPSALCASRKADRSPSAPSRRVAPVAVATGARR